jgi:hypothetical protein
MEYFQEGSHEVFAWDWFQKAILKACAV